MVYNRNRGFLGVVKNISPTETEGRIELQDIYKATLEGTYPIFTEGEVVFTVDQAYTSGDSTGSITRTDTGSTANATHVTYEWTCPNFVEKISIVAVGGGASGVSSTPNANNSASATQTVIAGGGGGALSYTNDFPVSAGQTYIIQVGKGGGFNIDAKGVNYATSVGSLTIATNTQGTSQGADGGVGELLAVDGGDSGFKTSAGGSFMIKSSGGFVKKNVKELNVAQYNQEGRYGTSLQNSSGGATSAPYTIDSSIIAYSGGGYGGEGGGHESAQNNTDYNFGYVKSEICGGGGAGGYGTDGVTNHYVNVMRIAVSAGKFWFFNSAVGFESGAQNIGSSGLELIPNHKLVFDWSDGSTSGHQLEIGYSPDGGDPIGSTQVSVTAGNVANIHSTANDTNAQTREIDISTYEVDTVNKRTILQFNLPSSHPFNGGSTSYNVVLYIYCAYHTGMGYPIKFDQLYSSWSQWRHEHFKGVFTGQKYYFKGNGQGGHGGSNTMIGNALNGYEHVLHHPHFGLSGAGGGGGSVFLSTVNSSVDWKGEFFPSNNNPALEYPTANQTILAGAGGGTSIFGLSSTISESTADIVSKIVAESHKVNGSAKSTSLLTGTNGSAGQTFFISNTGISADISGRIANDAITSSVAGTNIFGTWNGDGQNPTNSFDPRDFSTTGGVGWYFLGSVEGRGNYNTSVTTDQGWQELSAESAGSTALIDLLDHDDTFRVVFVYRNGTEGTSYLGDLQIDRVRIVYYDNGYWSNITAFFGNSTNTHADNFQRGATAYSTLEGSLANYNSQTWENPNFGNGGTNGKWDWDYGGTASNGTALNVDGNNNTTGGYLYTETSGGGGVSSGKYFWLRSGEFTVPSSGATGTYRGKLHSVHVYHTRVGNNIGELKMYLIGGNTPDVVGTTTSIPNNNRRGVIGGIFGGGGGGAMNARAGDGQDGAVRIIWGNNRNFPYNAE